MAKEKAARVTESQAVKITKPMMTGRSKKRLERRKSLRVLNSIPRSRDLKKCRLKFQQTTLKATAQGDTGGSSSMLELDLKSINGIPQPSPPSGRCRSSMNDLKLQIFTADRVRRRSDCLPIVQMQQISSSELEKFREAMARPAKDSNVFGMFPKIIKDSEFRTFSLYTENSQFINEMLELVLSDPAERDSLVSFTSSLLHTFVQMLSTPLFSSLQKALLRKEVINHCYIYFVLLELAQSTRTLR
eukprot:TRINITY_DN15058_c0_g1_i1.p1 TRINITY_DN15058_c0_g1~~TRINITY_DN15058_c0_g1_i1.p1  ORF type:complete len:245 (-),score=22.25 TRINITY_DN15058_c0_g1_i1:4-738(-)